MSKKSLKSHKGKAESKTPHQSRSHQEKHDEDVTKKSLLDVLRENMKLAQRAAYIHRLVYIGDHSFEQSGESGIQDVFEEVVVTVNEDYCEEKLSGFILYYNKFFGVVIDGPEDALVKHLNILLQQDAQDPTGPKFGRLKLLVAYHHANQRLYNGWTCFSGKPPTLLEKLNPNADLVQTMSKVRYVIEKLYSLGMALRSPTDDDPDNPNPVESVHAPPSLAAGMRYSKSSSRRVRSSSAATSDFGFQLGPQKSNTMFLPEYSVLEFLLASPYTIELRSYPKLYGEVIHREPYHNGVWPVGCDFTPMNLQAVDIDPITDLDPEVANVQTQSAQNSAPAKRRKFALFPRE